MDQRVLFLLLCGRRRVILSTFTCWKKRSLIVLRSNQRPAANERPFFWTDKPADDMKTLIFCPKHKENDVGIFRKYYVELSHFKKSYDNLEQSNRYFFAKKKIKYYLHIDWMVEKKLIHPCFLMKNPRNFHLLYVIALFGAQKNVSPITVGGQTWIFFL